MKDKRSYHELLRKRERLVKKLGECPPVLRGTVRLQGNKCGRPWCRCHDPKDPVLHGPYYYLSHRYADKSQTILLNDIKRPYAEAWIANYRELRDTLYELCKVNFDILRYHYERLDEDDGRTKD